MSLIRRTEAKEKKASKSDTTKINLESILQKLQRDEQLIASGANVNVWLTDPSENMLCKCYMRRDDCRSKKCKLAHNGVTIAHIRNVPFTASTDSHGLQESEKACLPPVALDTVTAKESNKIMFIAVDGACVFDYLNHDLWHKWIAVHHPVCPTDSDILRSPTTEKSRKTASNGTAILPALLEAEKEADHEETQSESTSVGDSEEEKEKVPKKEEKISKKLSASSSSSKKIFFASEADGKSLSQVFTFLSNEEVIALLCCSKITKSVCLKDELVRQRKKEAISAFAHDVSKKKKEEKRKKAKNACISKVDKKDAFARGATIR